MTPFTYARAVDAADAVRLASGMQAKYLGGGTNLVDLMRETIERPSALVDVTGLSSAIEERQGGGLLIGAAAELELAQARPLRGNAFKVELAKRTITAVLEQLAGENP